MDSKETEMRRWNKTEMVWDCFMGLETDIPVNDWPHPVEKQYVHTVQKVTATAGPERDAKIEVAIRRVSICPTDQRETILNRLSTAMAGKASVKDGGEYSEIFTISFSLDNGDKFCDTAIELVREIFKALGLKDEKGLRLAGFKITQETFFHLDDGWVSFARWLRMQHLLPVFGPEDM